MRHYDVVVLGGGIVGLWTALGAVERGLSVAVVELGPADPSRQAPARPPIRFLERRNEGAVQARNHVLTGNSRYWGGGLVRNPLPALKEMFGAEACEGAGVQGKYAEVERRLGIVPLEDEEPLPTLHGRRLLEVAVLPGKRRGVWSQFHSNVGRHGGRLSCFDCATIIGVDRDASGLRSVTFTQPNGGGGTLEASWFVLAMGAIDSVCFVQQQLYCGLPDSLRDEVGRRIHDHWSVPVATISWRNGTELSSLFPPKFGRGGILGRRIPLAFGFFHLTADLDHVRPYAQVKALLAARQRGAGWVEQLRLGLQTLRHPFLMLASGLHRVRRRELRIPPGTKVSLVLDFESAADPRNRLVSGASAVEMSWDVREQDEERFLSVIAETRGWWEETFDAYDLQWMWCFDPSQEEALRGHLRRFATDAYHLGGGLAASGMGKSSLTSVSGLLAGWSNVIVASTASFVRPGPANPVLTLLARCECMLDAMAAGRA